MKGARVLPRLLKNLSFHSVKLLIKRRHDARIKQKAPRDSASKSWTTLTKKSLAIPNFSKSVGETLFRFSTGHDCLPAYLHRFKLWSFPQVLCVNKIIF